MRITTIVNQKGGVGKTTVCRNLGQLLAEEYHKKVLLIDLDSSGNLSDFFDAKREPNDYYGAAEILIHRDSDPNLYIVQTRVPGLDILSGNNTLGEAEVKIKCDFSFPQQFILQKQLKKLGNQYDICLIDCPPTVQNSILVINAITCCDDVLVPCPPDIDSSIGAGVMYQMIQEIQSYTDHLFDVRMLLTVVGNKAIDKAFLQQDSVIPRYRSYLRDSDAVARSSRATKKSFKQYAPKHKLTYDMDNVAAEYLGEPFPHPELLAEE